MRARLPPPHGHRRAEPRPTSTPSWRRPARPCICCSTPATRPGAAPIRRRWPRRYRDRISHVHAKDVRRDVMAQARRPRTGASSMRWSRASSPCRATAWWIIAAVFRGAAGLFRLGRRRGRAGSGEGQPARPTPRWASPISSSLTRGPPSRLPEPVPRRGRASAAVEAGSSASHAEPPRKAAGARRPRPRPSRHAGSAGWTYVGFEVYRLAAGQALARETGEREVCLVLLSGKARGRARAGSDFGIDRRARVAVRGQTRGRSMCRPRSRWTVRREADCEVAHLHGARRRQAARRG